ncbi:unnamed protein product [Parascedosporium putredinis]|uniref:FAD-dependent oxidoreductase-like enzyme n=1 Tax=Parascedosporium putredinis TaxID=1442378 RepID=A0A9P1MA73_9PEZI|nr:unnamed protein product [Parascedosporium putredinis]CAI7992237.1 unnamed protein product [Parascedosporium putredinis]
MPIPLLPSSQVTIPSTEDPGSPIDPNASFKTEMNDDRTDTDAAIIPSSLTPPPSSQAVAMANTNAHPAVSSYITASQRSALFSPPTTVARIHRPSVGPGSTEYIAPSPQEVRDASADTLRAMMQQSIAENSRLKMEAAHYKLQLNLLSLQAGEDAKRAVVEHDMARREVEALREAENIRQARRELSAATESTRSKYLQIKNLYEDAVEEIDHLERKLKLAKKVIQQQEDEVCRLREDRQQLRTRIRENREHFNMLCSPGGIFHGVLTPKGSSTTNSQSQQSKSTPKQTPRGAGKTQDPDQRRFDALLQVLSQENNSAPSTPTTAHRPVPRQPPKHTRNVQSLSSLPTTPTKPRGRDAALLPSVRLAPQTEPPRAGVGAKATSTLSRLSGAGSRIAVHEEDEESDVPQSQASFTASQMLRRDQGKSFGSAAGDGLRRHDSGGQQGAVADKLLPAGLDKGGDKRKFSGMSGAVEARRDLAGSPPKKVRVEGLADPAKVGLGIKYP